MKKLYLLFLLTITSVNLANAQIDAANNSTAIGLGATSTDPNYKFTYGSYSIAHYGLGWYSEPVNTSPIGYLSGFAGFKFFTEGSPRVTITGDGNVGIGTTTPSGKLDVNGNGNYSGSLQIGGFAVNSNTTKLFINNGGGYGKNWAISAGANQISEQGFYIYNWTDNPTIPLFTLTNSGNVGIGTTDPGSYKLAVNGTIHSKAVIIDLIGWPDYVFKKDYKLMPLAEVKSYIDQNQHLPGLPTGKEVESKGLDVGEMNKLLSKKVEELTLYLIEKDKKDEEKETQLKGQQQQINELKQQLSALVKALNKN